MPRPSRFFALAAVAGALAMALAGCVGEPEDSSASPKPSASASGGTEASGGSAGTVVEGDVLAEQTVDAPNTEAGGSVTAGIRSLIVDGDVMTLRWTLGWDNEDAGAEASANLLTLGVGRIPAVIDGANLTMYRPFCEDGSWKSGAIDRIQCENSAVVSPLSSIGIEVPNGGSIEAWAVFPAVPEGVETVDVQMPEGLPGFTEVTVSRADDE